MVYGTVYKVKARRDNNHVAVSSRSRCLITRDSYVTRPKSVKPATILYTSHFTKTSTRKSTNNVTTAHAGSAKW